VRFRYYCPAGVGAPIACVAGKFNPSNSSISVASCLPCTPGQACTTAGAAAAGTCFPVHENVLCLADSLLVPCGDHHFLLLTVVTRLARLFGMLILHSRACAWVRTRVFCVVVVVMSLGGGWGGVRPSPPLRCTLHGRVLLPRQRNQLVRWCGWRPLAPAMPLWALLHRGLTPACGMPSRTVCSRCCKLDMGIVLLHLFVVAVSVAPHPMFPGREGV
jgi:hypothetical protein